MTQTGLFYILNGNKETNDKNLNKLLDRFGIDENNLDPEETEFAKIDADGDYVFENGNSAKFDNIENAPFELLDIYDPTNVTICTIDKKNSNFSINPDWLYGRISNGNQGVIIIVNNAQDIDVNKIKAQADKDAHHAYVINDVSNFDELQSDVFKQIINDYDIYDVAHSALLYGLMNHVPELKQQFDHFSKTGDFDYSKFNATDNIAILESALTGDKYARAFYLLNLSEYDDCGSLLDTDYLANEPLFTQLTHTNFEVCDNADQALENIKYKANELKDTSPELASIIAEGTKVLTAMAKASQDY